MENGELILTKLVDVETLEKVQGSFEKITGMEIYIVNDMNEEEPFDYEELVTMRDMEIGLIRGRGLIDKEEVAKAIMANEAAILSSIAENNYKLQLVSEEFEKAASLKSDFLANMSHEIRTPMNAVIGMAEMALREELPLVARGYINQIKSSGKALLTIINDILDFSKIESGKLDIIYAEYDILSLVNDVASIVLTRIGDKDVELVVEIDHNFPKVLMGDDVRIKQIIINLANNAVKFTKSGQVVLHLGFFKKNENMIELMGYVEDTGIGIKEENLDKLFVSFQQIDSKRNREIEGTGLGLAITKSLLEMMYGGILVESEYGVGSKFCFTLPQRVVNDTPCVVVPDVEKIRVAAMISNKFQNKHLESEIVGLGATFYVLEDEGGLDQLIENEISFLFIEKELYTNEVRAFAVANPEITFAVIVDFQDKIDLEEENAVEVRKPLFVSNIAAVLRHETIIANVREDEEDFDVDFCAPKARILLVDDNPINLTVEEGLLEPFQMTIDTAESGKEAIEKVSQCMYDLIFMDHMMPEMDGVEAMKIIREKYPEYNMVPIIALTANVVQETRSMFIAEGMNDFVAKPIEMKLISATLKRWLPEDKKEAISGRIKKEEPIPVAAISVGDLDTSLALNLLGSEKLFWKVLKDYHASIEKKSAKIDECYNNEDWKNYTIEVHALKSTSKQIGATELSSLAAELERAGNNGAVEYIKDNTSILLEKYRSYIEVLAPYCKEEKKVSGGFAMTEELGTAYVDMLTRAVEELDFDAVESIIGDIEKFDLDERLAKGFALFKEAFDNIDFAECARLLKEWGK